MSNAAFLAALFVTYVLTTAELSERTARTTVVLLCVFPASHFFLMPYSESLFLLLAVTAFWAASAVDGRAPAARAPSPRSREPRGRPRAGVGRRGPAPAGRAGRPRLARGGGRRGDRARSRCLPRVLGRSSRDWFAPITRQANWERTLSFPLVTLWNGTVDAFRYLDDPNGGYWLLDWVIVVPMLAASVYAVVRLRPSYGVYLWAGLLLPLTFAFEGRPLMSMPRFLLPLFPAFWGLALGLERLRVPRAVAYVAGAGARDPCLLTVNWYYIF